MKLNDCNIYYLKKNIADRQPGPNLDQLRFSVWASNSGVKLDNKLTATSLESQQLAFSTGPIRDASPVPSPDNSAFPSPLSHASASPDTHGYVSLPTPILRNRTSLDIPSSPASHTSDASSLQPPPSPTLSAYSSSSVRWANSIVLRDNYPRGARWSLLFGSSCPPPQGHRQKSSTKTVSSIGSSFTDRDTEDSAGLGLS